MSEGNNWAVFVGGCRDGHAEELYEEPKSWLSFTDTYRPATPREDEAGITPRTVYDLVKLDKGQTLTLYAARGMSNAQIIDKLIRYYQNEI